MSYMIEGGGSKTFAKAKAWLYKWPEASHKLMRILTDVLVIYLDAQVKAGAQLLQVFDSWAGELSPHAFRTFALPYLKEIAATTKQKHPQVRYLSSTSFKFTHPFYFKGSFDHLC